MKFHTKRYQTFYGLKQINKIRSLSIFVSGGVMKSLTAARSGLNFEHLKTIFNHKGED